MSHRKTTHSNVVPMCTQFLRGACIFQSEFCWYNHKRSKRPEEEKEEANKDESPSVFQEEEIHPKPPSGSPRKKETTQN